MLFWLILTIFVYFKLCNPCPAQNYQQFKIEEMALPEVSLEEVACVLKNNRLCDNFEIFEADVVDCPDLSISPFSLSAKGLGGNPTIVEVGSESYLIPTPDKSKVYDMKNVIEASAVNPALVVGAGAGPFPYVKVSSELIANLYSINGQINSLTQIAKVLENGSYVTETLPNDVTTFSFMLNAFISEGKPGKVLRVKATKRIGEDDFVTSIRGSLETGFPNKSVALGGAFLISKSKIKEHVQPDFSPVPLLNQTMVNNWLKFYDMDPPLVSVGTMLSADPGLSLRLSHFHSFSDHDQAGHYHYDLDPDTVEYLGYFNVGSRIVRIDRPSLT